MKWEKISGREEVLKTKPMLHQRGWGEAWLARSKSGKRYTVTSELKGFADGPMVFDLLQRTNMSDQIVAFVRNSPFSEKCTFGFWATCPGMTSPEKEEARIFAEFVVQIWDDLLQSYPDKKSVHEWELSVFNRDHSSDDLPPWIPESFKKPCQN